MKARSKPKVIEVVEFDREAEDWPDGVEEGTRLDTGRPIYTVYNELHDTDIQVKPGDFVRIDNPKDRYPIDREVFLDTYEIVEA